MTKVVLHYDEGNYLVSYNDTPDSYLGKLTYGIVSVCPCSSLTLPLPFLTKTFAY